MQVWRATNLWEEIDKALWGHYNMEVAMFMPLHRYMHFNVKDLQSFCGAYGNL